MRSRRWILLFACVVFLLAGCGGPNISAYADQEILVTGLQEEDFTITPAELSELECISGTAVGKTEKAGTVNGYGPTLTTFVEHYGHTLEEFRSIRFTAGDDYTVLLGKATWAKYDVILSIARGNKALYEGQRPLRLVIPGGESGNWIYNIQKIEFTAKDNDSK